jgi:DNA-binding NtrC family response regulator
MMGPSIFAIPVFHFVVGWFFTNRRLTSCAFHKLLIIMQMPLKDLDGMVFVGTFRKNVEHGMPSVLLVDDEKNVLTTLSLSLKRYDFAVRQAQNGPDALRLLEKAPSDFVVSDIRMTPMDGFKLASVIQEKYPNTGIVLMSAYGSDDFTTRGGTLKKYPRLTKPFPITDLVQLLRKQAFSGESDPAQGSAKILLFDEGDWGPRIRDHLSGMGFRVELAAPSAASNPGTKWKEFDCIAINEDLLSGERCVFLNAIDQHAPELPLVLITGAQTGEEHRIQEDIALAVVNRDFLFQEPSKAGRFIRSQFKQK